VDDLSLLMAEVRKLSQTVEGDTPSDLRGKDANSYDNTAKGSQDVGDSARTGLGIMTGGGSWLIQWAGGEDSKAGKKPKITWEDLTGAPLPDHKDRIEVSFAKDVALEGTIEIALKTDSGSHWKGIEFEPWDPNLNRIFHGPNLSNGNNQYYVVLPLNTP